MKPGDRVFCTSGQFQKRLGTVERVKGTAAMVLYDGEPEPHWCPLKSLESLENAFNEALGHGLEDPT